MSNWSKFGLVLLGAFLAFMFTLMGANIADLRWQSGYGGTLDQYEKSKEMKAWRDARPKE